MATIADNEQSARFLDRVAGLDKSQGNPRTKKIVRRIVSDLYRTIEELEITEDEYWGAISLLTELGQAREVGLVSPGLGFDHFMDVLLDAAEKKAGIEGGTPRTIEGPLYVYGAPLAKGEARLDDGTDKGEVLFMSGRVTDADGKAIPGAIVDVWHANSLGNYSYFDKSQSEFNLRRRIETDDDGRYRFRSIMPAGYGVDLNGPTQTLLAQLGRHGKRPAHIHFFVSAPGQRHLTTQINISDDPLVNDDFAFATRDGLIPRVVRRSDPEEIRKRGLDGPFAEIEFDFVMHKKVPNAPETEVHRERARIEKVLGVMP
ncbi:MAG: catechol 1,2-dioxygenase [Myxococcaceae bacterium]